MSGVFGFAIQNITRIGIPTSSGASSSDPDSADGARHCNTKISCKVSRHTLPAQNRQSEQSCKMLTASLDCTFSKRMLILSFWDEGN